MKGGIWLFQMPVKTPYGIAPTPSGTTPLPPCTMAPSLCLSTYGCKAMESSFRERFLVLLSLPPDLDFGCLPLGGYTFLTSQLSDVW